MSIYYLPIENNFFDGLYKKIMEYDNDIYDETIEYFPRDELIHIFLKGLNNVYEEDKNSILYLHYQLSNSIDSFFRTIIKPSWDKEIESFSYEKRKKNQSLFSYYNGESFIDTIAIYEDLIRYFLKFEEKNRYMDEYGMFEISTEETITPILFPKRDKNTNELIF